MNPVEKILQWFAYEHLPPKLQEVSKPVGDLARDMAEKLPLDPETTAGLRKLLEAKDCFVRAAMAKSGDLLVTKQVGTAQEGVTEQTRLARERSPLGEPPVEVSVDDNVITMAKNGAPVLSLLADDAIWAADLLKEAAVQSRTSR